MVMLRDGFKTIITITGVSGTFEEIEVSPPELDAGGSIDQTTMRNTRWRTFILRNLGQIHPRYVDRRRATRSHNYVHSK